jgi:GT2 family glycosyltransferase
LPLTNTAVVILNYNGRGLLQKFLPGVLQFSTGARIIIADNHSSDGSQEMLTKEFPGVELIQLEQNLGFCGGYNFALKQITSDYFVLLNSDVEVSEGWLRPLVDLLDKHPTIAAAQPKILSYHHRSQFEYAGAAGGFIDLLGYPFCRGRIFDSLEEDQDQYNDTRPVFWATGACMMVRATVFKEMGGFDEDFFAHMEEIDLCWKMQRAGHQIFYTGESKVYHIGGGTLSSSNPRKTYFNFRNGLSLLLKHESRAAILWKLPVRMSLDWLALLKFLYGGSGKDAMAVLRAHMHFLQRIPHDLQKRRVLNKTLVNVKAGERYPGSIVLDFFIKKLRRFSDLRF